MLEINNVNKFFGGLKAVNNASMKVEMGSITGLIGPNGAGKTTLFNTIAGLYDPDEGNIILNNEDISFLKPHELFAKGVLRTFQIAHEFSTLTVLENLMMVPPNQFGEKLSYALLSNAKVKQQEEEIRQKAIEVINFLNLSHLTQELAGNLSGGQKKKLVIALSLMSNPKVLLLDECFAALDVLKNEFHSGKLPNDPLIEYALDQNNSDKILITPHAGGATLDAHKVVFKHVAKTLRDKIYE